jgi:hypothetical protein
MENQVNISVEEYNRLIEENRQAHDIIKNGVEGKSFLMIYCDVENGRKEYHFLDQEQMGSGIGECFAAINKENKRLNVRYRFLLDQVWALQKKWLFKIFFKPLKALRA